MKNYPQNSKYSKVYANNFVCPRRIFLYTIGGKYCMPYEDNVESHRRAIIQCHDFGGKFCLR